MPGNRVNTIKIRARQVGRSLRYNWTCGGAHVLLKPLILNQPENEVWAQSTRRANARLVFFTFLLTFIASRILVFLIMSRRVPDLFLHVGGTHVHHLNYGIFLLCGVGAYLLFGQPTGNSLRATAIAYGIGLALTFDEFGMWIHLGGSYWQRASFDAVAVLIGILGFIAYFPSSRSLRRKPWWQVVVAVAGAAVFFVMLYDSFRYAGKRLGPRMEVIEQSGPE
jgi:hypothetical protein